MIAFLEKESVGDQLSDRGVESFDGSPAEGCRDSVAGLHRGSGAGPRKKFSSNAVSRVMTVRSSGDPATYFSSESAVEKRTASTFDCGGLQHGMRVYTETEIWLASPIFQIVPRLKSCAGEVGYLVLRDACGFELFAGARHRNLPKRLRREQSARDSAFRRP